MRLPIPGAALLAAALLSGCGAETTPTAQSGEAEGITSDQPSLTVAPAIGVSPTALGFRVYAFRPTYNPPSQTLKITYTGGGKLNWTATDNGWWLGLGPTSGTAPTTVTVRVNRASIPIGINGNRPRYLQATITISAPGASNTPRTIPVGLTISYDR